MILTLGSYKVTDARLTIPAWGASYADVTLDGEYTLSGATTLVIADLTVKCTVLSGGPAAGRSFYRVVAGAGGWGKIIPARSYANDAGTKWLTILSDAASACGETLDTSSVDPSLRTGPNFVRPNDMACRLLEQLAPNGWYVGEDGQTRIAQRATSTLSSKTPITSQVDLARGTVTLASDTIANILPGITVNGIEAVDVEHTVSAKDGLRSKLWGRLGSGNSRRLAAFRAIVDQLDPDRMFRGTYEYRVVTQEGERLNLQIVRKSTGLPDLSRVIVRPGVMGAKGQPALGSRVLVRFVNQDPGRPVVIAFEDAEGPGFVPLSVKLDASNDVNLGASASTVELGGSSATSVTVAGGSLPVARQGDQVTSFLPPNLTILLTGTLSGTPYANTAIATIPNPISGVISGPCSNIFKTK